MTTTAPATSGTSTTPDAKASPTGGHGRLIALLVASAFVVILNETIMSVALPDLMREFDVQATTAQWLTTAFLLTMAAVIPVTGWLLTRFPLRTVFVAAMSSFSIGTLVAALAPVFPMLVAGRVVQAIGTALMMPLLITTILNVVDEDRRGQMMGTISIVISVAPAIGPTVSGLVLDQLSWRWMFWIVLPIALLSLALGAAWVRNVTEPRDVPVDVVSVVLSALAFGGLIYGLSSIGESASGHTPVPVWVPLVVGALALATFVARQLQLRDKALLDLRAFAVRTFAIAVALVAVSMMALFGSLILLPIYLQNVLGLSVLNTGLLLLPGGLTMGLLAPIVGRLFDRIGPRPLVAPGAAVVSVALWGMTTYDTTTAQSTVVGLHVLMSIGLAFMFTPLMTSALGSLPPHLYSHGSAIVSTLQQVAGAAGTALFVTVMTRVTVARSAEGVALVDATAEGIHAALMYGGAISAVAVLVALLVRRPRLADLPPAH
ncbi:MFS transporter, DHA2 family, lincomycin resistance protein [Nocardioides exalbidus]|uniref:MFS transporter, DHA2 family, lincomycin resistance protein n=1 Tax=Nocardioides exalbidus TaxID=402596 RepID=A0A1H4QWG4_9ACTN|nr:DHA2 family efflux MFS transporter permease subunit [Nocardioides exalbidus]SEC23902.1 MFS transporter, DHA2 family, lincomycin resistance protein [Nocardioides exalbidus]